MAKRMTGLLLLVVGLTTAACGGGGDGGDDVAATSTTSADAKATPTTAAGAELPQFAGDFDRVCTTQVGFAGTTTYEPGPGPHPVILFERDGGENYVATAKDLPAGWAVKEDSNFEDNSELKALQLVACSDRVKESPTGKVCEFDNDGEKVKLELVDSTYELTVYAAKTGKELGKATLEAKTTECPMFATFKKGDKTLVSEPDEDQYTAALKPHVAP